MSTYQTRVLNTSSFVGSRLVSDVKIPRLEDRLIKYNKKLKLLCM